MKKIMSAIWHYFKKMDKLLMLAILSCSALSEVLIYSMYVNKATLYVGPSTYKTQAIATILGLCCALIISIIDYNKFAKLWYLYAPAGVFLVLLTFTPLGKVREGTAADDRAWLDLGVTTIQPSEFLKIAFIVSFAYHLSKVKEKINKPMNLLLLCLHGAVPIGLIALQGDGGTAIVFGVIFILMFFVAGISWKYILSVVLASPILAILGWNFILTDNQRDRFLITFNPELDPLGLGHQQIQGKIALGSGQLHGKGLFGGEYMYVSEMHNDFIFSYLGQVFGFIGCAALCAVIIFISIKILFNGITAKDNLGKYICIGVFAMYFSHVVLNIGMVLGVMPVIGVPLPLVSAGGSSVLSMYLAMGLVFSVYQHSERNKSIFY